MMSLTPESMTEAMLTAYLGKPESGIRTFQDVGLLFIQCRLRPRPICPRCYDRDQISFLFRTAVTQDTIVGPETRFFGPLRCNACDHRMAMPELVGSIQEEPYLPT